MFVMPLVNKIKKQENQVKKYQMFDAVLKFWFTLTK